MESKQGNWKNCCTCDFWTGQRKPSYWRDRVEYESGAKGECAGGGWNRSKMEANGGCSTWRMWSVLKK
ncbi:MAG: hypothetical protein ACOYMD_07510 [Paludibacter sp.]